MGDFQLVLGADLRSQADRYRASADRDENLVIRYRKLAALLDRVAGACEVGECDSKVVSLLELARPISSLFCCLSLEDQMEMCEKILRPENTALVQAVDTLGRPIRLP
jgi:hypothetical protein